jgi:hypothetical protein
MKIDRYTKIILTVIAICLIWICIKDISLSPSKLFARPMGSKDVTDVRIVSTDTYAFANCEPIEVRIKE